MAFTNTTYSGTANRGIDLSFTIRRNDNGQTVQIGGRLMEFSDADNDSIETIDGIDNGGLYDHIYYAGDISGTINVTRYNGDYDTFVKFIRANFFSQGEPVYCTIVAEKKNYFDGSLDTDTYTEVVLHHLRTGPWRGKTSPKITFDFVAQELT